MPRLAKSSTELTRRASSSARSDGPRFPAEALTENLHSLIAAINKSKPATSKGVYLRKVSVSSTMGAGIRVDTSTLAELAVCSELKIKTRRDDAVFLRANLWAAALGFDGAAGCQRP